MAHGREPVRDIVRGLTALEMCFVNKSELRWTRHSGYIDQPTYADTMFPCFAFLSGMSRTSVKKGLGLVGLGLALNTWTAWLKSDTVRIPGVLQRIGVASLLHNTFSSSLSGPWYSLPLVGFWYFISISYGSVNPFAHPEYSYADPSETAQTKIDHMLFGSRIYCPSFDPEGLLGSIGTALTMLSGQLFKSQRLTKTQQWSSSILAILLGELMHTFGGRYAPISKTLWTPSFVLVTSGYAAIKCLLAEAVIPFMPGFARHYFSCVGQRSLEVYILSVVLQSLVQHGGGNSLWSQALISLSEITSRRIADLALSLCFSALLGLSAMIMVRKGWKLTW